jgi:5-methylcytosine-specific restriction endonuclease McrA
VLPGCRRRASIADHIISRREGGSDDKSNLRSLCVACDNWLKEKADGTRRAPPAKG